LAASSVMLPETFRIWKAAGLRHVLVEGGSQAEAGPVVDQISPVSLENASENASGNAPGPSPEVSAEASASPSVPASPATTSVSSDEVSSPAITEAWPYPWDGFRERLTRPSHSIWTYLTLGADMGGTPDPERRKVLTQVMAELGWPKGSIAFWPLAVLEEGYLCENTALFRQGTEYAQASYVVCFGEEAFRLLCPEQAFIPGKHDCSALPATRCLLALPGLEALSLGGADWVEALSLLQSISPA
jgi:hypothetical protein